MIHALCPKKYKIVTLNLKHSEKQGCCSPTPPHPKKIKRGDFSLRWKYMKSSTGPPLRKK